MRLAFLIIFTLCFIVFCSGCASGPPTKQQLLQRMYTCQRVGGIWYTASDTPEYIGKCDWSPIRSTQGF